MSSNATSMPSGTIVSNLGGNIAVVHNRTTVTTGFRG
jgi:hypothetical protein